MLNFIENMNRIEYLTAQILIYIQEGDYQKAREGLDNIHVHTTSAQQQLHSLEFAKAQGGTDPEAFYP